MILVRTCYVKKVYDICFYEKMCKNMNNIQNEPIDTILNVTNKGTN